VFSELEYTACTHFGPTLVPCLASKSGHRGGVRYVVRVRDPERGKYTSATFATKPEAEQFGGDVDRGVAWALSEYRRAKGEPTR
jgi:hypothetical protein